MGGESWHAIKKLFNPPFLILKVRHPAVTGVSLVPGHPPPPPPPGVWPGYEAITGVYCIVRDNRSGCSNDFKCCIAAVGLFQLTLACCGSL